MDCPHCKKPIRLPTNTVHNVDCYGEARVSITRCCGRLVHVHPVRSYRIEAYTGERTEDDWARRGSK